MFFSPKSVMNILPLLTALTFGAGCQNQRLEQIDNETIRDPATNEIFKLVGENDSAQRNALKIGIVPEEDFRRSNNKLYINPNFRLD